MNDCNCNPCKKSCQDPCGCPEPAFSVDSMPDDPTVLRYNINGKSVWYDHYQLVKEAETATTVTVDIPGRTLNHHGEKSDQTITAKELGSILHLGDLGDVDAETIENNGILNYRREIECGEGCEAVNGGGWVATNPTEVGTGSLSYILGTDNDGEMVSLMPPSSPSKFSYLAWAAQNKAKWVTPTVKTTPPKDSDNKVWRPYIDPSTGELVIVKENA